MNIDENQSINNARSYLNEYVRLKKRYSSDNSSSNVRTRIYTQYFFKVAEATIKAIIDDRERMLLTECYVNEMYSSDDIQKILGIRKRQYYKSKRLALLSYAMVCPGRPYIDENGNVTVKDILVVS